MSGCNQSPELGKVTGLVLVDGQPGASLVVTFQPVKSGRPAVATTDEDGRFVLSYTQDRSGALLGAHEVFLQTIPNFELMEGQSVSTPIDEKYQSPFKTVEIKPGSQEFKFEVTGPTETAKHSKRRVNPLEQEG
ncbi:transthyretin-like family protein [Gimesia aquarii]|uniref:hypothetical protein n=1 Tax=Gimesia aquarii TaxID=2527964 RepID=UPI0011A6019B|nr:hypothetical protein [Gimesia aquarii]